MVLDLNAPLSWRPAVDAVEMLDNLQANILTPHVRDHLRVLFLNLGDALAARTFLAALVEQDLVKSARTHLAELDAFEAAQVPGSPYVGVALSRAGYALVAPSASPDDPVFVRGMASAEVGGPDTALRSWLPQYRQTGPRIHAVVLVGDAVEAPVLARSAQLRALLPEPASVVVRESGVAARTRQTSPRRGEGSSQPVFLTEHARRGNGLAPLSRVLVREPGSAEDDNRFGSYLTIRKLEQTGRSFGDVVAPDPCGGRTDVVAQRGQTYAAGLLSMTFGSRVAADPDPPPRGAPTVRGGEHFFLPSLGFLRSL